jgi:tRNA U34 5-methylaminomethyl-2-thiouridine-forming methyltransferase MnmC
MESPTLITTTDGSHSLLSPQFKVAYHSHHGAIQETKHVFIEAGLLFQFEMKQPLQILELGLGTGLNAFMTFLSANSIKSPVSYTSLEQYPISWELAQQCNYVQQLEATEHQSVFQQIHCSSFREWQTWSPLFRFRKFDTDALIFHSDEKYSLVYYDAFAPESQPELWTAEMFSKIFDLMTAGGVLVTYCAKGQVKRALKQVGFKIVALPGPPGKREMTRAVRE